MKQQDTLILRLLEYSWTDIDFIYDNLTEVEKSIITKEQFDELCFQIKNTLGSSNNKEESD